MAKKYSGQNGCEDAAYFNQLREEVPNRYLCSYEYIHPSRIENIVKDIDCCDKSIAKTHLQEIYKTGNTAGVIFSERIHAFGTQVNLELRV